MESCKNKYLKEYSILFLIVTQVYTKNLDQQGETDAIIDFNSDMEVTDTKMVHGRRFEEEKPAEQKVDPNFTMSMLNFKSNKVKFD